MRVPRPVLGTIAIGCAVTGFSGWRLLDVSVGTLALFVAAAILTELIEEADRQRSRNAVEIDRFRLASAIQIAAVIVLGPWAGAIVAVVGVLAAALLRGPAVATVLYRASAFALAAAGGGGAFWVAGGTTGRLKLLQDLLPLVALGLVLVTVRTLLLEVVLARESFQPRLASSAGELALGAVVALLAVTNPWDVVAVAPIALSLHWAQLHMTRLQRETLRALETFANIVDERDPSTYRHSIRVAGYVDQLARALRLPYSDIDRLRWAGRLHDLGKVAVDSSVLRKASSLTRGEWADVRRHPRLSARLLRRFEFVAAQAQAVELHHERMDGRGYYGLAARDLPLAAHFLIVADSFDAMTTDRPYRPALARAEALREIERNVGAQFHPGVAKAFVAVQRGVDPVDALTVEELRTIRNASAPYRLAAPGGRGFKERPELVVLGGVVVALGGLGFGETAVAIGGAAVAAVGAALRAVAKVRSERLSGSLRNALAIQERDPALSELVLKLSRAWPVKWAAIVAWDEDGLGGRFERTLGTGPAEAAVTSWLVREAESGADVIVAPGHELGREGVELALPLRRETAALGGFLVLEAASMPPRHVELALLECLDEIGLALVGRDRVSPEEQEPPVSAPAAGFAAPNGGPKGRSAERQAIIADAGGRHPNGSNGGRRTAVADDLRQSVQRVVASLSLDEAGDLASTEEESHQALDHARLSLARYRAAPRAEQPEAADRVAQALDAFLSWPRETEGERGSFTAVLGALEEAAYTYPPDEGALSASAG